MARKTKTQTTANTAPAAEAEKTSLSLAEALAESGQTLEDLAPAAEAPKVRIVGTSNLARTIASHRKRYAVVLHPKGNKTQNNGDLVAALLLPIPLPTLRAFGAVRFGGRTYEHLNEGHARMCLGNLVRSAVAKGEADVLAWLQEQQPKVEQAA